MSMLKWQGDFTLPRLRAKLASKYRLHPDVEPEYGEIYRPDLSHSVILRQDSLGTLSQYGIPLSHSSSSTRLTGLSKTHSGSFASLGDATRQQFSRTAQAPFSKRMPERVSSVPDLGTRRALLAPASLTPAPPGMAVSETVAHKAVRRVRPPPELPPPPPADDLRAIEREKQAELASRRLWVAANANVGFLDELVAQLRQDGLTNTQMLSKLKSTQVAIHMNKARKEGGKVDWRSTDWDGATLLIKAVRTNATALMMYMLALGADTTILDNAGRGLLHWIAIQGSNEMASFVFDVVQDLEIDEPDDGGDTPLHLAAFHGHLPIVRMLIRRGAEALRQNACGFTACELAETRRQWHVASYLGDYKLLQDDKANATEAKLIDLIRPCNQARANQVRKLEAFEKPKPKEPPKPKK